MRIFALVSIAALAAALPATSAQAQSRGDRAGHSWGQPRGGGHGGGPGGPGMHRPRDLGDHHRSRVRNFQRIGRGHVVPRRWFGPQYQVRHWQQYGFPQPQQGYRWVRYYDDALLIDGRGTVHDGRFGLDWDSYGERWMEDEGGVPLYAGDYARDEGYGYDEAEGYAGGWDYSDYQGERGPPPPPRQGCGPCGQPAYGYAAPAYGYGYAYGPATVTITETTVTTGGSGYSEEVIEEYEEQAVRQRARRVHRAAPVRRPIRGERG